MRLLGVILIVVGILALAVPSITFFTTDRVADSPHLARAQLGCVDVAVVMLDVEVAQPVRGAQGAGVIGTAGDFVGTHKYKHRGTYTVFVTFTDADGDSVTQYFAVVVS